MLQAEPLYQQVSRCEMGTGTHREETRWVVESEKEMRRKTSCQIWQLAPLLKNKELPELIGIYELNIEYTREKGALQVSTATLLTYMILSQHISWTNNFSREVVSLLGITNKTFSTAPWAQSGVCSLRYLATCPGEKHLTLSCFVQPTKNISTVI